MEFCENGLIKVEKNGKWGFINKKWKLVTPIKYLGIYGDMHVAMRDLNIDDKERGYKTAKITGNKFVILHDKGKRVTKKKYDDIYWIGKGLGVFKKKGKYGVINKREEEVIAPKFEHIRRISEKHLAVGKNDKWGIVNNLGEEISPVKYDDVEGIGEGLIAAELNGKWGVISE